METSQIRISTIAAITAGTVLTGLLAYAAYFDHKRRSDPNFRKNLKREHKLQAKAERDSKAAEAEQQKAIIKQAVTQANMEGYPAGDQEKEAFFMEQIQLAEDLAKEGKQVESAAAFFKSLKVYPNKSDLISIFDKSVQKDVLEIIATMVAIDDLEG